MIRQTKKRAVHTDEVMIHSVLDIILRDAVFSIDYLQLSPLLKWMLLKTQQVEDASQGLDERVDTVKAKTEASLWINEDTVKSTKKGKSEINPRH